MLLLLLLLPDPSELLEPSVLPEPSVPEVVAVVVVELEPPSEPELEPDVVLLPPSDPEPESEVPSELPDPEPEDELLPPPPSVVCCVSAVVSCEPSWPLPEEPSPDDVPTSPLPSCEPDGLDSRPAPSRLREPSRPELPSATLAGVTATGVGAAT